MRPKPVAYKKTLKLPRTRFPMRASLAKMEPAMLERWERIGIYDRLRDKAGRPSFVLHDGPPYANGHLHIGHALNKVLKDMVVRSQQMLGKDARFVPGWDCHGLPIEWRVEERYREQGKRKDDVPVLELRNECRQFAGKWIDIQRNGFRRMGVIGNWPDPYLTMDFHAEAVIADEFMKFVMNGSLYRGSKPVMWSTVEKTALAEAEVDYEEHVSDSIWVRFPIDAEASPALAASGIPADAAILIWTTTAWTIPSNRAICFNPEIDYALYEVVDAPDGAFAKQGQLLIVAEALIESCMNAARVDNWQKVCAVPAEALGKMVCSHPFRGKVSRDEPPVNRWDYPVPLLPGDHVKDEAGTGFVHTAPSHGEDDFLIGQRHGLPMTHNVMEDGRFRSTLPIFGGLEIYTSTGTEGSANSVIIDNLICSGHLAARRKFRHSYPHSWRSKAPLIFRNTPQWFVNIDKALDDGKDGLGNTIRQRALNGVLNHVEWTPPTGRSRIHSMLSMRPDWVLSRQRAWGVPLACFVKKGAEMDGEDYLLRDERVNARIVNAFEAEGADAWYQPGSRERFLGGLYVPDEYEQIFDILDVWFDSGSTHAFALRDRADGTPDGVADLYLEGTDQHRGWFHSSILQSCGTTGKPPYRGVLTHGFTLDSQGKKMSKSLGNVVAPQEVVEQHGADILRLWVAQSDYTSDLRIGPAILKTAIDNYRRIRNAFRFVLGNLHDLKESEKVPFEELPELERWVLHRMHELDGFVRKAYASYDFRSAYMAVFDFLNSDLSRFYFDIRKDRLYCELPTGMPHRASRTVLAMLFDHVAAWLAPILPFTADELWLYRYPGEDSSIHLRDFIGVDDRWKNDALADKWNTIRRVRRAVNAEIEHQRDLKSIGSSLEAAPEVYVADSEVRALLASINFADVCLTSQIVLTGTPPAELRQMDPAPEVHVRHSPAVGIKCTRCWKILPDVGTHEHPDICGRCNSVVAQL
ncbi:MAG: isoleucine--tRNA ligase [Rhodobacteraceae bacterium]|nr:isoleucine--tRNA ligase [Paracoccaceae bacterium]